LHGGERAGASCGERPCSDPPCSCPSLRGRRRRAGRRGGARPSLEPSFGRAVGRDALVEREGARAVLVFAGGAVGGYSPRPPPRNLLGREQHALRCRFRSQTRNRFSVRTTWARIRRNNHGRMPFRHPLWTLLGGRPRESAMSVRTWRRKSSFMRRDNDGPRGGRNLGEKPSFRRRGAAPEGKASWAIQDGSKRKKLGGAGVDSWPHSD